MLVPVSIPDLGAGSQALKISAWFVEPGDAVEAGEKLCEVLISGITCEVVSPGAGRVARIVRDADAAVSIGDVVAWIEAP